MGILELIAIFIIVVVGIVGAVTTSILAILLILGILAEFISLVIWWIRNLIVARNTLEESVPLRMLAVLGTVTTPFLLQYLCGKERELFFGVLIAVVVCDIMILLLHKRIDSWVNSLNGASQTIDIWGDGIWRSQIVLGGSAGVLLFGVFRIFPYVVVVLEYVFVGYWGAGGG